MINELVNKVICPCCHSVSRGGRHGKPTPIKESFQEGADTRKDRGESIVLIQLLRFYSLCIAASNTKTTTRN
jgi:hypothetical protein